MTRLTKPICRYYGLSWLSILAACSLVSLLALQGLSGFQAVKAKHSEQRIYQKLSEILLTSRTQAIFRGETLILKPLKANWSFGATLYSVNQPHTPIMTWPFDFSGYGLSWHGFYGDSVIKIRGEPTHLAMNGHFLLMHHGKPVARFVVSRLGRMRLVKL